ncbi:hypothetical protein WME94_06990 [Sorangium sp. So ce429]
MHKWIRRAMLMCAIVASLSGLARAAHVGTGRGRVTYLENGWFGEGMAVHLTASVPGCKDHEYAIPVEHPSYKDMTAMLLSAFINNRQVELVVDQGVCIFGDRTKVLSVRLSQ